MENKSCLNCKEALEESFKFCPECGQEAELDESVKSLLTHFLNDYFTFDSKIIRSVVPLITRPAFLTQEYLVGRRVKYIAPLRLFIFLSLIFFLLLGGLNPTEISTEKAEGLNAESWNRLFDSWLPKLFFFLLPLFALIISALYRKQKKGLMPHFLFALHFHASVFLIGIVYGIVSFLFRKLEWVSINFWFVLLICVYIGFYLWRSLRRVYGENRKQTSWKFIVLIVSYSILLVCSSFALLVLSYNY